MALLVKDIKLPLNEKESLLSKVTAKTLLNMASKMVQELKK